MKSARVGDLRHVGEVEGKMREKCDSRFQNESFKNMKPKSSTMRIKMKRVIWPFFLALWPLSAVVAIQKDSKMESAIPLIDLELSEGEERIQTIAQQIRIACQEIGFFAIVNHGVNVTAIQNAWDASREFFDLSPEEKQRSMSQNTTEYPYGYEHSERLAVGHGDNGLSLPDLKETFAIGPSHPESGMPPRRYPDRPINLESVLETYYEEMEKLARRLLRIFAIALELPPHWFESKFDRHQSALRLLNYPLLSNKLAPGQLRAGEHTDYGALTILKSGGPGLQVRRKEEWVDVPYMEDAFIINIGDLMQRWTNDKWVSTLHRVVANDDGRNDRRLSIAFFVNMNGDAHVEPIESCGEPKYKPITAGAHLMAKHLASMGIAGDEL